MEMYDYDILIIGGGASGLVAAIKAKDIMPDATVAILEKMESPGKKVAAAGNGKCNLSNTASTECEGTLNFFSSIGLFTRVDSSGRVYPYSEDGRDVVSILIKACEERGVEIICMRTVAEVEILSGESGFTVYTEFNKPRVYRLSADDIPKKFTSRKLLIASGGKSKPEMGTTGDGFVISKKLGHGINTLIPVLTGVETVESPGDMGLSGTREKAEICLYESGNEIFRERGEIQFADYGLSGICVFNMSRFLKGLDFSDYSISIDFVPDFSRDAIERAVKEKESDLYSLVKKPIADVILNNSVMSEDPWVQLKDFVLHPKKLRGWDMAQITRGGIPTTEIREETGESLIVKNLYFSGEIIDRDFPSGGFNLQHAWSSGFRAGVSVAKSLKEGGK